MRNDGAAGGAYVQLPERRQVTEVRGTTIAHVSDIHVGAHDDIALDGLVGALAASKASATIVTGDLTMRARHDEFARAKEIISQFPAPTMVVLGNHDISLTNPLRRMSNPYGRFRSHVTDELDPVLDVGNVRILGLQSMPRWRWKSGRVSQRQADLVRATFEHSSRCVVRVVALHHPLSLGGLESLANRALFERALVDAEIDIVLAGHTHRPKVEQISIGQGGMNGRTIVEVVAGTATSHRTRGTERSWSQLMINRSEVTITEHVDSGADWRVGRSQTIGLAAP